jgi:uncharacterized protein YlzI (FlbEa/FlbD family)
MAQFREFTTAPDGRTIRLNPDQISEIQAHSDDPATTVITMASGNKITARHALQEVLAISQFAPIGEPRGDQHARPSGWQKVCYRIWLGDVVVNEEPCRALFRQVPKRSLRGLLNVGYFW